MSKFKKGYLIFASIYIPIAELTAFGATNHWIINSWLLGNLVIFLIGGAIFLGVAGVIGYVEGII